MTESSVTVKGTQDGLFVMVGTGDWETVLADLERYLESTTAFFAGGEVILEIGERVLQAEDLEAVINVLNRQGITLTTVLSQSAETRRAARQLGCSTLRPRPQPMPPAAQTADGLVVRRTLRSGQIVQHPGSVVIVGDVNPGAEVVAGGDIIVWGRLRGLVHAGALGDDDAIVCALVLSPTQLRIGRQIARPPEDEPVSQQPEMARVVDGQIVVEPWEMGD